MPTPTVSMPEPTGPGGIRVDFASCWRVDGTQHYVYRIPCLQLLLVESGQLFAQAGGRRLTARPGDLLCLVREPRNEYGWHGPTSFWETHLTTAMPLLIDGSPPPALIRLGDQAAVVHQHFEALCNELGRPGDTHRLRVQIAGLQILAAIAGVLGRAPPPPAHDPWQRIRDRLDADYDQPLTVAEVAREADMTEDGFIRAFRRQHGLGPMAWRAQAKMHQACRLLGAGEAVKTVAARLGFTDTSAFARAFRRQVGIPPSEYAVAGPGPDAVQPPSAARPFPLNQHVLPPGTAGRAFVWG